MPITAPRVLFPATRTVTIEEIEIPDPGPNEVRVRTTKTLISAGSERNVFEIERTEPRVPGYLSTAVVEAVGPGVSGWAPGDRVMTSIGHQGAGLIKLDGSETSRSGGLTRIPDAVSDADSTFVGLGTVGLHAMRRAGTQVGDSVAVFGQGVVGQMITQVARAAGAYPVIAVDIMDERLEKSAISGASDTVNSSTADPVQAILDVTEGEGARVVFMVTRTPIILPDCMRAAAPGGTVSMSGSPPGTVEIGLQEELLRKELSIIGTHTGLYPSEPYHMFHWTYENNRKCLLGLMERGDIKVDHLITHQVPYTEIPVMYEMITQGPQGWLGIVLEWPEA